MLSAIGALLGIVDPVSRVVDKLAQARLEHAKAQTDAAKIGADERTEARRIASEERVAALTAQRDVLLAESQHSSTRWVRPVLALPVCIFWAKVIIYDTVLGWGVTPYPGDMVAWFVVLIPSFYFFGRPFEKRPL